jgi:uncharacterized protein YjbK
MLKHTLKSTKKTTKPISTNQKDANCVLFLLVVAVCLTNFAINNTIKGMKLLEQELKLQLNKTQYLTLLAKAQDVKYKMQHNHYFYYDGMPMDRMLRIRHVGETYELCYKLRKSNSNGVMVAQEYNAAVDKEFLTQAINDGIGVQAVLDLLNVQMSSPLRYIGCLSTMRATFTLFDSTIELDLNEYLGEVDFEVECENDDIAKLAALRTQLEKLCGKLPDALPKVQRFVTKLASTPAFCNGEAK